MQHTSMRVSTENRDALQRIAREMGAPTMDDALKVLMFEHDTLLAYARLATNPKELADYRAETAALAETDVEVAE